MQRIPGLYIRNTTTMGRGVYCAMDINEGSTIEVCPVIIIPQEELPIIHKTTLHDYYFLWGKHSNQAAIALGFGSIYNHEVNPNANFLLDIPESNINIFAIKDISAGQQITINYQGEPGDKTPLWFDLKLI